MGLLRHRRFRRQENLPDNGEYDDDYEGEEGEDDYDASATIVPSAGLPSTTTENPIDKAKAIGKDVIEKVPSKSSTLHFQ